MTEAPSNTSNHQRLNEMLTHLTPKGAVIPYNLCFDSTGCIWVASKGGLFKFDSEGREVLFKYQNQFSKKMAPYCHVQCYKDKIFFLQGENQAELIEFRIMDLDGNIEHESFIDGKVQGFTISPDGVMYMTKQPPRNVNEFVIYKTEVDVPLGWDELVSAADYCFQSICAIDSNTIVAATCTVPINMYSKQSIVIINATTGNIKNTFSSAGREAGQIYFPRSIQPYQDGFLILDKTGRIQHFDREGKLLSEAARIDAYLGNGFVVRNDEAVLACSGIVQSEYEGNICDDWVETIKLNGSCWTEK